MAISARKENLQRLVEYIKRNKPFNYPIQNNILKEETDFVKNLYFKMLAVVLQSGDFVSEVQLNLYMRLLEGAKAKIEYSEYFRQAVKIRTEDFDEFMEEYGNRELKYRFLLDSIILCMDGERKKEQLELVAGIAESFRLNPEEVKYLSILSKSILLQSFPDYEEPGMYGFQSWITSNISSECMKGYIELFDV